MPRLALVVSGVTAALAAAAVHRYVLSSASIVLRPAALHPTLTMRAVSYDRPGDSSVLRHREDHPRPVPRDGQILIEVRASSINPCDFKFRRNRIPGFLRPLPKIPGEDVAGVVAEVAGGGGSSGRFAVGDRVAAMLPVLGTRLGAAAGYVAVDESLVARIGDRTSFEEAASLPLVSLTVVQGLRKLGDGRNVRGKKILIQAGAGGVGTFAVQYAKKVMGMHVTATASSGKTALVKELGADVVVDYRTKRFEDVVTEVDVVFDPMSWAYEGRTLGNGKKVLKPDGHYLNIMGSDWSFEGREKANGVLMFRNAIGHTIRNFFLPGSTPRYDIVTCEPDGAQLQYIMDLLSKGTIQAVIDRKFPLEKASSAYEYLETGHATGKVILQH